MSLRVIVLFLALCSCAAESRAAAPVVEFDAPAVLAVRDVTTAEFAAEHPHEKLIAASLQLSSLVRRGDLGQVLEITYRVENVDKGPTVYDYAPRTSLAASIDGNIAVERQTNESTHVQAQASGRYFPFASADAALDRQVREWAAYQYELPPPTQLVASAGTLDRGRGVYYKLRPARDAPLEGAREFLVVWRVPAAWRASRIRVTAQARSAVNGILAGDEATAPCGAGSFDVGLYVAGDAPAREAIAALLAAEAHLVRARAELEQARQMDFADQVREKFDEVAGVVDKRRRAAAASREAKLAQLELPLLAAVETHKLAARKVAALASAAEFVRLPPVETLETALAK